MATPRSGPGRASLAPAPWAAAEPVAEPGAVASSSTAATRMAS